MNQEQDKEFDVLLRRYAKREGQRAKAATFFDEGNGKKNTGFAESEHLDADAMNAYAENALPSAARMRYAEHLIGCDACRKVVTQLALTANPIGLAKEESGSVSSTPTQTWREKLLSLLTFPSLKLAGSVAAVLLVGTVTFVVWQKNNNEPKDSVANKEARKIENTAPAFGSSNDVSKNGNAPAPAASPATSSNAQNQNNQQPKAAPSETSREKRADTASKGGESKKEGNDQDVGSPSDEEDKPREAKTEDTKAASNQPTAVNAQATPTGPAVQNQVNVQQEQVAQQRQTQPSVSRKTGDSRDERNQPKTSTPPPPAKKDSQSDASGGRAEEKQKKVAGNSDDTKLDDNTAKRAAATTRAIGGKQFQRIGNAWVDVAYKNSKTIDIKRGSDEYKALEASLRYISEQLGGEVVIVWTGKAYKIR